MRSVACVGFVALCLALTGCSWAGKKSPAAPGATGPAAAPASRNGTAPLSEQPAGSPYSGILAGQVIDSYNRRPPPTRIKVIQTKDKDGKQQAPIELDWVDTDGNGYFMIQKLQAGGHYQLIAVARDGSRKLAGMTFVTAPDPRVLIRVSEDLVTPTTPDPPPAGAPKPGKPPETSLVPPPPSWPESPAVAIEPPAGAPVPLHRAAELGQPLPRTGPSPAPPGSGPSPPPDLSRTIDIHGPGRDGLGRIPVPPVTNPSHPVTTVPSVTAPVPFCVLTGRKLENFALNDLNGQPWEFKKDRRGRLVLLDFWWTGCIPCRQAIPHLNILQQTYGPYGMEIVSIAYETGSFEEQTRKVRGVRDRQHISYRLLLGTGLNARCPVRTQFQVASFPTLVLLDETGQIIWRSEGLDAQQLRELETLIRQRLGVR